MEKLLLFSLLCGLASIYAQTFHWSPIANACLAGYNDKTSILSTVGLCRASCEAEVGFVCKSFDYKPASLECVTSSSDKNDFPGSYQEPCSFGATIQHGWR